MKGDGEDIIIPLENAKFVDSIYKNGIKHQSTRLIFSATILGIQLIPFASFPLTWSNFQWPCNTVYITHETKLQNWIGELPTNR